MQTGEIPDKSKIWPFRIMCSLNISSWFINKQFKVWNDLEGSFQKTWYIVLQPIEKIELASKLKQKEDKHIRDFILKFKNYCSSFKSYLKKSATKDLFMKNTHEGVRKHFLVIKEKDLVWEQFIQEVVELDNLEPHSIKQISSLSSASKTGNY